MSKQIIAIVTPHAEEQFLNRLKITKYKSGQKYDFSNYYEYAISRWFYCKKDCDSTYCDYYVCTRTSAVLCVNHDNRLLRTVMTEGFVVDQIYDEYYKRVERLNSKFVKRYVR